MFILFIKLLAHSFVSFKVNCMLWNSHFLNAKFSKLFMFIPRFQFGLGNLVKSYGKVLEIHRSKCVRTLQDTKVFHF